ncbi:MAG: UvrD-helicase domain-containing protein [Bacteroidales bacterium]|nr:UvrD-helicase domain-containing protein [Bacteroidales bacterium]
MKPNKSILQHLNDQQKEAVVNYEGPTLIIAGAGAGKTRVLTHRIAYMLSDGISPERIMALTFTNKAADEMKERIGKMVSYNIARRLWMGTFHSIFRKILKNEAEKLGYISNFSIYDTDDSQSLIKSILKELQLYNNDRYKPKDVLSRISHAKNNLITVEAYKNNKAILENDYFKRMDQMWLIYERYQHQLKLSNAMDFDDLLLNTNILFRDFPDILTIYQHKFDYILVDEYQDTNYAQYLIIKKLSDKHKNLCVVGDDSQSIYSFRGARIENILNFKKDYPNYKLFKLEQNYRSTKTIVNAANTLIEHNKERIPKVIFSENEEGEKIEILKSLTEVEEAYVVAKIINELHNQQHIPYHEMAVLYRTNAQSRTFEDSLRRLSIPYRIYGGHSFYQRKEIKDVLAYLRLCINEYDSESLKRIINYPARGIGDTTLQKLETYAQQNFIPLWDCLCNVKQINLFTSGTINKIEEFVKLITELKTEVTTKAAFEFTEKIIEKTGIKAELEKEKNKEEIERMFNVQELLNSIKEFEENFIENYQIQPTIIDFLEHVSLLTSLDENKKEDKNESRVTLMTAHSAKGLEYDVVFIVGAEKNKFPLVNVFTIDENIEEERRLFYVAMTRARKKLFISFSEQVLRWGNIEPTKPSPFISEIDSKFLNIPYNDDNIGKVKERKIFNTSEIKPALKVEKKFVPLAEAVQKKTTSSNLFSHFKTGDVVLHERFGRGVILRIEGTDHNTRALVDFGNLGQKQLLLKYANLTLLN